MSYSFSNLELVLFFLEANRESLEFILWGRDMAKLRLKENFFGCFVEE